MNSDPTPRYKMEAWRMVVLYVIGAIVIALLIFRLFSLQIFEGEDWQISATDNFTREVSVPASRGILYDRNGVILARNIASYNVVITPAYLPDDLADS